MLFYAVLKEFGNLAVFSKFLSDCNRLKVQGIIVEVDELNTNVYFIVAVIIGDNLGLHSMLGFVESFKANYACRLCKLPKAAIKTQCSQINELLRTKQNYENDLHINNLGITGIKSVCVWNSINSFHVTENYFANIMHDILEGVAAFHMMELLHQFILTEKLFSTDTLNYRIKHFQIPYDISNGIPLFTSDQIKN